MSGIALGIDIGTTSVKVLALDRQGTIVDSASSHHGIQKTTSGVQIDADLWSVSLLASLRQLSIDLSTVEAVGFSGNMSSVVLVDEHGESLHPALLLADSRGADQLAELTDETVASIVEHTGNLPETVFSLSSLLWFRDNRPDLTARAAAWVSAKDYLRAQLTGVLATDPTDAYNSLLLREGSWNDSLISQLSLPRRLFPAILPSDAVAGTITAEAAHLTGLPAGIPVATGAGDVAASIAGSGGLPEQSLSVSLGTSAIVMAAVSDRCLPPAAVGRLTVHPTAEGSLFALGSLLTGGLALNWVRSLIGSEPIAQVSASTSLDSDLVFLPYLAGTGSPDFISEAKGTLFGITPATAGTEIVAALIEAIAFDIADLIDLVGASNYREIVVSGGGSRIVAWPQVLADVSGLPVNTLDIPDLSAIGAAVLGWSAAGERVSATSESIRLTPRPEHAQTWAAHRARYTAARRAALDFYTR